MREITLTDAGRRLDRFLFAYFNTAPRPLIYKYLRMKKIKLNGKKAEGDEIIAEGDKLTVFLPDAAIDGCMAERDAPAPAETPDIVYEDDYLLLLNKPAGLLTHAGNGRESDTLLTRVLYYLYRQGVYDTSAEAAYTPALCNRLDRNTSGLVVCGKTPDALRRLSAMFAGGQVKKEYMAVVHGVLEGQGTLSGYFIKDERLNIMRAHDISGTDNAGAVQAVTNYEAVTATRKYSLLRVFPITGKTHQIRAQLAQAGHPLAGDIKYGGKPTPYAPAQLLHCKRLAFAALDGYPEGQGWQAPLPGGFNKCLKDWFN